MRVKRKGTEKSTRYKKEPHASDELPNFGRAFSMEDSFAVPGPFHALQTNYLASAEEALSDFTGEKPSAARLTGERSEPYD